LGGEVGPPLIAVGCVMAPLLMQDTARMIFFAQSRAELAAINDALWAVVQFTAITVLIAVGTANTWSLVLAWGSAAAVCVLLALAQLRTLPRPQAAAGWVSTHRDLVGYLLPETLLTSGGLQASILLVGKIVGVLGVGALRAAQVLLGPLGIVGSAVMSFALPEISRRRQMSAQMRWRAGLGLATRSSAGRPAGRGGRWTVRRPGTRGPWRRRRADCLWVRGLRSGRRSGCLPVRHRACGRWPFGPHQSGLRPNAIIAERDSTGLLGAITTGPGPRTKA
jgi:hypothetical protein